MIQHIHTPVRIRVGVGEMTCTVCDEVTNQAYCMRCNEEADVQGNNYAQVAAKRGRMVPTISYLREEEYEVVG